MNLANQLTFLRIILSFLCVGLTLKDTFLSLIIAFFTFVVASLTDYLDGFIARRKNLVSDLGKLLDPVADKILVIGVFLAFLELGVVNTWMVVVIMLREFVVTGIRFLGLNRGVVLEAKKFGKNKTFSQILGIVIIYLILILEKAYPKNYIVRILSGQFIPLLMWYIVGVTLFSGVYYLWANRRLIRTF
ncbi:MAG: CDP-diacylglycerol--glycerol-3-phosphate 3-phosphatidyltransferase [Candidatus Omnitrophota bacterium]|nr:CDP-diacylglycerol--glycerol-3-phosphate 3-phosphatidyltransferase [Candidatus Omnitrophota bacterium]RKY33428.1 MAG: CDP-diacylglycerol--glycerol-3-phosphate 3-phosphatidyltransferase [Candidatus Omnitrophota bacterium]RKY46157.1 MAG: CDP-diacylglycerol--glycerol-3-phosphate 3-phosphatidyltransferase [Candidatus Omnitrophota bacterium]HDN86403.1 CDP-diacylglycerol--glycerol-3-phosphate 3-phosphatidyltransferase [Candidatus Omnitrophota bacterium]